MTQVIIGTYDTDRVSAAFPKCQSYPSSGKFCGTLRQVAATFGIKMSMKIRQDQFCASKLSFYLVDVESPEHIKDEQYQLLNVLKDTYCHTVIMIDKVACYKAYAEVNAKYPSRMDNATYKAYQKETIQAIASVAEKIAEPKKLEKQKPQNYFNLKVGDIIRTGDTCGQVTRVTESSYFWKSWLPKHHFWTYPHILGIDTSVDVGDFEFPIAGNEHLFKMSDERCARFSFISDEELDQIKEQDERHPDFMGVFRDGQALSPDNKYYGKYCGEWDHYR